MGNSKSAYTIRQVIELTGISEFTLRGWENRYKALTPARTDTGRRVYSSNDLLKAKALYDLTLQGHKISVLANLNLTELLELTKSNIVPEERQLPPHVHKVIKASLEYNWLIVEKIFSQQKKNLSAKAYIYEFILPLISEMSSMVASGKFNVTQEHIISAYIKEHISQLQSPAKRKSRSKIVMACPEGDFHDMGILIASRLTKIHGVDTLYLGAHFPKRDLAETCHRYGATHLLISSTVSKKEGAKEELFDYLSFLDRNLEPKTHIWVAGRNSSNASILKLNRPYRSIQNFEEFENQLQKIKGAE